jgi:hypothetical protein
MPLIVRLTAVQDALLQRVADGGDLADAPAAPRPR